MRTSQSMVEIHELSLVNAHTNNLVLEYCQFSCKKRNDIQSNEANVIERYRDAEY